jgi:hypothetical protein
MLGLSNMVMCTSNFHLVKKLYQQFMRLLLICVYLLISWLWPWCALFFVLLSWVLLNNSKLQLLVFQLPRVSFNSRKIKQWEISQEISNARWTLWINLINQKITPKLSYYFEGWVEKIVYTWIHMTTGLQLDAWGTHIKNSRPLDNT